MTKRSVFTASATLGLTVAFPSVASAHGIGGRLDLPVPVSYFVVTAAVVLVVSFVVLSLMWPEPRFEDGSPHRSVLSHSCW